MTLNAENSALHHKLHFKIYSNSKQLFYVVIMFTILQFLLYFWSNKCSFGKQKRFSKTKKIQNPNFLMIMYFKKNTTSKVVYIVDLSGWLYVVCLTIYLHIFSQNVFFGYKPCPIVIYGSSTLSQTCRSFRDGNFVHRCCIGEVFPRYGSSDAPWGLSWKYFQILAACIWTKHPTITAFAYSFGNITV